ncbi:glucan biosynthesis protein [Methylobacterium planeticum]|uniref:Glucan biosynthesis protein n=1 Tax=Methylobacterium planeticum TaxID=2615211 RepID=A0A6N6MDV5_9HYPH|nr:glucan biosynthesis protein D [Methylobacterium planeticum]KAB1067908.1 glucan biosynthesis protein [Methylobacterium planeticum]
MRLPRVDSSDPAPRARDPSCDPASPGSPDHTRRALLRLAGAASLAGGTGLAGWAGPARAAEPPALPAPGARFEPGTVVELARALAAAPYAPPRTDDLPASLKSLSREQYGAIRAAPGSAVWAGDDLGYTLEPLHRGSIFPGRVALALVEDGVVRALPYDRARFETGGIVLPEFAEDPGYAGFRLRARFEGGAPADFAVFQGASFFRLVAKGQGYGVTARALTLRPADARGEEFPLFRAFWVERPGPGGAPLVVHALIDSESCAGALRMSLRPGEVSLADIEGTIFPRRAIDHLGLGGMQVSYLFGPHDRRGTDDARAAAHAAGGLQIRNGAGEAIWRPVHNPDTLQISSFLDQDPKGFGLMQRARAYADFEDDVQHWEWRPSLWLEPLGPWGEGAVTLLEIPSDSEFNENILAYWRPRTALAAGAETRFAYRQFWCWEPPERPPVARVTGTRSGHGSGGTRRLFLVDFTGEGLFAEEGGLETVLGASPGGIARQSLYPYPERGTVRVAFELDPGSERACELRLALTRGGRAVTETWLYRWTP